MAKLADLFVKLGLKSTEFNRGIDKAQKKTNTFGKGVSKIGGLIAGAFAVGAIINFGKELVMLGGIAEGVRNAFERVAPEGTMEDLQKATAGTVSELELMKRAVSAKNLGLPIEQLASLFEFATKRAQETGESVDFLVNSIVTGIGRKSPLILDNLGISAIQLREKLKGVGFESAKVADIAKAVGEIAADSMEESGKIIDTNAIKVANLAAQWDDVKVAISESGVVMNTVSASLTVLQGTMKLLTSDQLSFWQKLIGLSSGQLGVQIAISEALKAQADETARLVREQNDIDTNVARNQIAAEQDLVFEKENHIKTIGELRAETDVLKESLNSYNIKQGDATELVNIQIAANEKLIKSLTTLRTARAKSLSGTELTPVEFQDADFDAPFVNDDTIQLTLSSLESLVTGLDPITEQWGMFWNDMNDMVEFGVEDMIATFAEGIGRLAVGDIGFQEFFSVILDTVGNFLGQMGKMLIAYGIGMTAFKKAFTNPVAAIAAGIALVAIGGAISGLASRGPGSGVGGGASGGSNPPAGFGVWSVNDNNRYEQGQTVPVLKGTDMLLQQSRTLMRQGTIG
jgi:hypothetical protein